MPKLGMKAIRSAQLIEATMQVVDRVGLHKASVAMIGA
ncbi:MAG TPA: transcriptional regulator BetI, partial [Oceanospirillaceae bacterium]|nr:transcriptional regulator BetI [Oceanospirillaceae bacterium]